VARKAEQVVSVGSRQLTLTNLEKVMYPETGTTKGDVIRYYSEVAGFLLPYAAGRPVTRKRWVDGVDGPVFFQKDLEASAPEWVPRQVIHHKDHDNEYPVLDAADGPATLAWFAQLAALELHVPQWRFTADGERGNPDRMVFDLDPGEGVGLPECVEVARLVRAILDDLGMPTVPVTSGSKGIHLYAVLDGTHSSEQISELAHELARSLEADHPELVISTMRKADRRGKVMVDWSQNNAAKTTIAPYSLRGRSRPYVAMPRTWREITSGRLRQVEMGEVMGILRRRGDAAEPLAPGETPGAGERPGAGHRGGARRSRSASGARDPEAGTGGDRLARYRSMRDATRTPEPVPARAGTQGTGAPIFVIQRHEARRLHHDFRLERDGVLVSWALPKGVPALGERNHLAVHVEDHPLEYASFHGDIPRGEYGAGHVEIWDHGSYETEKWRDDEVIVTLHGAKDGGLGGEPAKLALIRTDRDEDKNWLIHRMALDGAPAVEGGRVDAARSAEAPVRRSRSRAGAARPSRPSRPSRPAREEYLPMLAELGSERELPGGEDLAVEMKWDGVRVIAYVQDGSTRLMSRNNLDITPTYPEFAGLAEHLGGHDAVLDGEVIAVDRHGYPNFGLLQQRMRLSRPADVSRARRSVPVRYVLFDILALDGEDLSERPYRERRRALEETVSPTAEVLVPPQLELGVAEGLEQARELHLEGIVVKDRGERYFPGRRSRAWTKIKLHRTQEVIVGGWRPGQGRRSGGIGSLLLGVPDGERLCYVGRVGTGFGEDALAELERLTRRLARKTSPLSGVPTADARDAHWIAPVLVGEVQYAERTTDGRLRQASWRGLRPDKSPEQVRAEW